MYEPNMEKTSVVIDTGTYSYRVMLSELKNAGATIKSWLIESSKIKLKKTMEVYIDDSWSRVKKRRIISFTFKNLLTCSENIT